MPSLGPAEILVVLVIALLVFGPNKMPDIAKQVGKGFREFRRVQQHLKSELRDVVSEFDSPSSSSTTAEQHAVPMLPPNDTPSNDVTSNDATPAPPAATESTQGVAAPLPSPEPDAPSESA